MKEETPQELLERTAPLFGLKKAPQKGGGYRWAERKRINGARSTPRAANLGWTCAVCQSTNLESDLECGYCDTSRPSR
jgi:hypothetical protein